MVRKPVLSEQAMQRQESDIPQLAGEAVKRAYRNALNTSGRVIEAVNGKLVETSIDGRQRVIRNLSQPLPIAIGTKRSRTRAR